MGWRVGFAFGPGGQGGLRRRGRGFEDRRKGRSWRATSAGGVAGGVSGGRWAGLRR
jgi:hypothetical protein